MHNIPLDSALARLVSSGVIKKEKGLFSVNLENNYAEHIIAILSSQHRYLKNLPFDVYFLLADAVNELSNVKGLELWLFGSYSKMVYNERSDVDLALLVSRGPDKKHIQKVLRKLEKHYLKEIEEHFFDVHEFYKNKKDPLVKEIMRNGVRLM